MRTKETIGQRKPFVELQFILTKLNQNEVKDVKKLADSLGVDRLRIKSFALSEYAYSKEEIKILSEKFLPDVPEYAPKIRYEKRARILKIKNKKNFANCRQLILLSWLMDGFLCVALI